MSKPVHHEYGERFNRLTVICKSLSSLTSRYSIWWCKCDCSKEVEVRGDTLRNGSTKSCGCLRKSTKIKHGLSHTTEYDSWYSLKHRCLNKNDKSYKYYGGRGITICERWTYFENFLSDIGNKPSPEYSIDRINNNGNYEPGNVKWATMAQQSKKLPVQQSDTLVSRVLPVPSFHSTTWSKE